MHHNPTHPAVKLKLDGVAYHLRFDFEAIATAEEITDRPLITGLRQKDVTSPKISLVQAMLFACLIPDQPEATFAEAKALVTRDTLVSIWTKILEAWTQAKIEPDAEAAESDPPKDRS
jgi:hypothetical protein